MNTSSYLVTLKNFLNTISPISESTWQAVEPLFKPGELMRGAVYLEVGQVARKIAFLSKGVMRGYARNVDGATYNKHFFIAPCFIGGYSSMITRQPNRIVQDALTDCEFLETDYSKLVALYDHHHDLERVARRLAELFFVEKEQREVDLVMLHADERYEKFQQQYPGLEQLIPQYHIASYLGVTPTQLSRIRKRRAGH